jgi:hypothetical protein
MSHCQFYSFVWYFLQFIHYYEKVECDSLVRGKNRTKTEAWTMMKQFSLPLSTQNDLGSVVLSAIVLQQGHSQLLLQFSLLTGSDRNSLHVGRGIEDSRFRGGGHFD